MEEFKMPYEVRKTKGGDYEVYNPETGKVYGTHPTKGDAEDQRDALYANTNPEDE
jgi:hypothetical protein